MRQRRLDDPERGVDVGLDRRVESLARQIENRPALLLPRRVADHDVEPAEAFDRLRHEALAEGFVAEVSGDRQSDPPGVLDQRDDLLRIGLLRRIVVDRDVRPFAGEGDGGRTAHAGIAAGNQRAPSGEPARAAIALLAVVRRRVHLAREAGPRLRLPPVGRLRVFRRRILQRLGRPPGRRRIGQGRRRGRREDEPGGAEDGTARERWVGGAHDRFSSMCGETSAR